MIAAPGWSVADEVSAKTHKTNDLPGTWSVIGSQMLENLDFDVKLLLHLSD
ncbi:hypothetical protein SAMN05216219_2233 [Mycetocola miduiensis]|uniref:Uncharacterized protein n=1 Tax=Mycetocola miduiensis TaxID=995034 RepID=A0A1I5C5W7_9MICO|nr:hypothetical protein SAMN05216219_2233 [Mycetocola miduiensis]